MIALWVVALFIAGAGVGIAWPHLSAWIMGAVDDAVESGAAAAAINTVQLISGAFGAGLAGVVVNTAHGNMVIAARALFAVFAAVGFWAHGQRTEPPGLCADPLAFANKQLREFLLSLTRPRH